MNFRFGLSSIITFSLFFVLSACEIMPQRKYADVPVMDGALHITQEGETLGAVAKTYDVSVPLLRRVNNVSDMGQLPPGIRLFIPGATEIKRVAINQETAPIQKPDGLYHPVAPGETLSTIAKAYEITMKELQEVNNLYDPNELKAGDQIWVPRAKEVKDIPVDPVTIVSSEPIPTPAQDPRVKVEVKPTPKPTEVPKAQATPKEVAFPREITKIEDIKFQWPLKETFTVLQDYDASKLIYGMDLGVAVGTPVCAAADGIVDSVGNLQDDLYNQFGNYVMVLHGEVEGKSLRTIYAYNQTVTVKKGDKVARGGQIATVGNSGPAGNQEGGILHFEVRKLIDAINPRDVLPALK